MPTSSTFTPKTTLLLWGVAALLLVVSVVALERSTGGAEERALSEPDALGVNLEEVEARGTAAATELRAVGTAGGYLPDSTCARCHADLYRSYQEVGMAQSFYRPGSRPAIEDFTSARLYHQPSRRYYEMQQDGEGLLLRRYQLAEDGKPINQLEQRIDWILGSGHTSRSYLYQSAWGELYQLPIAWYTQSGSWGMAPGYDEENHQGTLRRVRRECMFCHNAYPDVPAGSDDYGDPQTYPAELPEGLGCQRCHGPGAEHVRRALDGDAQSMEVRAAVVNPRRLGKSAEMEVCMQCHLQPSVALSGVRRFGRGDYSHRPGEPLAGYVAPLDVEEERPRSERFEINHHPYRLLQSPCYLESAGELTCTTCHDPHRKVPAEKAAAHYRKACLSCHQLEQCDAQTMQGGQKLPHSADLGDCASCHMPKRRTEDVVGVAMTDHRIGNPPEDFAALLAPIEERSRVIHGTEFLFPSAAGTPESAELYRAVAMVRGGSAGSLDRLHRAIESSDENAAEPRLDLAQGLSREGRWSEVIELLEELLSTSPGLAVGHSRLGVALAATGRLPEAREHLGRALELEPENPEALYNLGKTRMLEKSFGEAEKHFRSALELRPNLVEARFDLGVALALQGRLEDAAGELSTTLALDPRHTKAYLNMGQVLLLLERPEEARRYLRHGVREAEDPEPLEAALAALRVN